MGNSSSSAKSNKSLVTKQDEAILQMKIQRDNIKKYQRRIRTVLDREREIAKECLAKGDKNRALLALRKKKYQEQLLSQTDKHLETLEDLTQNIEFAKIQKDIVFGLEQGNKVLQEINKEMTIERVEKIMDDSAEGIAYQKEISEMLAQNISNDDEMAVQEELEALEKEELEKSLPSMPEVPKTKLNEGTNVVQNEEESLKDADKQPILA